MVTPTSSASQATVCGNHVESPNGSSGTTGYGLNLAGVVTDVRISDNYFKTRNCALLTNFASTTQVSVTGNVLDGGNAAASITAINVTLGLYFDIASNIIFGWTSIGISFQTATSVIGVVEGNIVTGCGSRAFSSNQSSALSIRYNIGANSTASSSGILFSGANGAATSTISGNNFHDNAGYGVAYTHTGQSNRSVDIHDNLCYNNTLGPIDIATTTPREMHYTNPWYNDFPMVIASNAYPATTLFKCSGYAKGKLFVVITQGVHYTMEVWDIVFTGATSSTTLTATLLRRWSDSVIVGSITAASSGLKWGGTQTAANGTVGTATAFFYGSMINLTAT